MRFNKWSVAVFVLFSSLLIWYLVYTQSIVAGLHESEERMTEVVSLVQELIQTCSETGSAPGGDFETVLFELQEVVIESGIPMVWMGANGTVLSAENLPFETDIYTPAGQDLIRGLVREYEMEGHLPVIGVMESGARKSLDCNGSRVGTPVGHSNFLPEGLARIDEISHRLSPRVYRSKIS